MLKKSCPICGTLLANGCYEWHFVCENCNYENANLESGMQVDLTHNHTSIHSREIGLKRLRVENFTTLLKNILLLKPHGGTLLEIGCADGWFLELAKKNFSVLGIESDIDVGNATASRGLPVKIGCFPNILDESKKFDIIIFNDVIEHIPNIEKTIATCYKSLNKNGLLVLNLPNSKGIIYKISKKLVNFRFTKFFDRMWQKQFSSPHLHYFNLSNLIKMLTKHRFHIKNNGYLKAISTKGLYTRTTHDSNTPILYSIFIYIGIILFLPISKMFPSDIMYVIAKRP